ncbi:MAG: bifunctional 5,6,7,8-tetrahydromethanopterin hydro-lyase/3-hexulose-6-phosphate synthase [Candidatus Bathyarchaeota archaeon]|nr:bifunctional 5,6,7,8-tetrahydromethanopterin hydro-lyase/3-hexulose-6-phosphate synthase [Candidatus Bathyarchaeota archaeon]
MSEDKGLMRTPGRITQEQYRFLEEQVEQGRFGSMSEAVRAAIDRFQERTASPGGAYLIGEALVGEGDEVAHIDLLIGDKTGPVGAAFAQSLSTLSAGHTPLLAVIRPNLPPKPFTVIVPKVTVRNMEEAGRIFGPAQSAVAKAVADAVEDGIVPRDVIDDWVVVVSVFIHPRAEDERRIYHYNYSATKLALSRALQRYPSLEKVMYDKDRARHPLVGFRAPRLWRPPYLQVALDLPNIEAVKRVVAAIPRSDSILLEAGTPLIKRHGVRVIRELREASRDSFIIADLKTMDVGKVEVDIAFDETADAVCAAGAASTATIDEFIYEARRLGIYSFVDLMEVDDPVAKLRRLERLPDGVILHRAIDVEQRGGEPRWGYIGEIREAFEERKLLIAVAGGIRPITAQVALDAGADILIVGRYITQSRDVERAVRDFLPYLRGDIDLFRVHVE